MTTPPDALDVVPAPDILAQRRRWTILTRRIPSLRAYRPTRSDLATPPPDDAPLRVRFLWELCCSETADLAKVIMCSEIDEINEVQ